MRPEEIAARLVEAARRAGAEAADALVLSTRELSVAARSGALESAEGSEGLDFGLRALVGRRQACVSGGDPAAIAEMAERAVAMARAAPEDPWCGLPEAGLADPAALPALEIEDPAPPPAPAELRDAAAAAEAAALSVPGIAQAESAEAGWSRTGIVYCASNGFAAGYARSSASIAVSAVAGEGLGMETDYDFAARTHRADLPPPEAIGREAGARAAARLRPGKARKGAFPVLFDRRVAGSLIGHALAAIDGAAVARGASWAAELMGEALLPPGFALTDEPFRRRGLSSRPFDGEGLRLSERRLVEDGALKGWTLDAATARRLGLPAPGGARRGTGGPPSPGTSNLRLSAPARPRAALLREMGEGLLVTQLLGASISPTTGAYSRGAAGFWVERGEIAHPVNELTIAGSLPEFLKRLRAADDADETRAMVVPSLLAEGLMVAAG